MSVWLNVVVPLASAILGAILGAVITGQKQVQSTAMAAFVPARLEAYKALEAAIRNFAPNMRPDEAGTVYEAVNAAALVASPETLALLGSLNEMIRTAETEHSLNQNAFLSLRHKLILSMRDDLFSYPVPKSRRGM